METPGSAKLRKMPYSELKKYAKAKGIKSNLKAKDLISLLLKGGEKDAENSFVTLENEIMNSCKKNKLKKFEEDKEVVSDTPRRETYTLERPTGDVIAIDNDLIVSSASPVLRKTPPTNETSFNVTMSRGSQRKTKKRKVSFVTPMRKSARLSAMTPHYASVKDRPKTPIPSRVSSGRKLSPSVKAKISFAETPSEKELESTSSNKRSGRKGKRISTPMPSSKCKRMKLSSSSLDAPFATPEVSFTDPPQEKIPEETAMESSVKKHACPVFKFSAETPENKRIATPKSDMKKTASPHAVNPKSIRTLTPRSDIKKTVTPLSVNPKNIRTLTPRSGVKKTATPLSANPKNRILTPKSNIKKTAATPVSANPKNIRFLTPRSQAKKNSTPFSVSEKDKRTPRSGVKSATTTPGVLSESKVKIPNFKELHRKAFDKMESIDEYQQRKAVNSAKKLKEQVNNQNHVKSSASKKVVSKNKKINKFGGIPFVPSVTSTKSMKLNESSFGARCIAKKFTAKPRNVKVPAKKNETPAAKPPVKILTRENTPLKRRFKFDLQASLTKKLPYKPHKGPVKPLAENNLNVSVLNPSVSKSAIENKFVQAKRVESRNVVRGVRTNRRFELQMQKRNLTSN